MKKHFSYTLVAIAMGFVVGSAQAANDVYFTGSVTNHTCDLVPDAPGSGGVGSVVSLGSVAPLGVGSAVEFSLKPADPTSPGCSNLPPNDIVDISWMGSLSSRGLQNTGGTSADSWAKFETLNAEGGTQTILTNTSNSAQWKNSTLTSTDGAKFKAQLMGGNNPGTFIATSAFVVAYH